MDSFVQYKFLDLLIHVYSNVSEISSNSNFDLPFSDLFLFHPPFIGLFCLVLFSLGAEALHSIYSCNIYLQ